MKIANAAVQHSFGMSVGMALTTLLIGGCALPNPTHHPGLATRWNPQAASPIPPVTTALPIDIVLHTHRTFIDDRPSSSWLMTGMAKRAVERGCNEALKRFPFLSLAKQRRDGAPYRLVIEATHATRRNQAKVVLSALTLFLIPANQELSLELEAHLYQDSTLLKTYEATGTHRFHPNWFNALSSHSIPKQTIQDTFCDLFLQIQQDGGQLFSPTQSPDT